MNDTTSPTQLGSSPQPESQPQLGSQPALETVLRERFGFDAFRPGQREAIESLLAGSDLLVIQPTGHGKSLLYQLPAVLLGGLTLVISPLLALMRDQLGHLEERFGIPAGSLNSDQEQHENNEVRRRATRGELSVLFVSPEQLDNVERLAFLAGLEPRLVVIDEAHCISTWGHDFRPAYREIARLVGELRERTGVRVLALTATADKRTQNDIETQLAPIEVQRRTMDRPNLALSASAVNGMGEKLEVLETLLAEESGCGLLYCATRENTEIVAEYLSGRGRRVAAYHAGMAPDRKRQLQQGFLAGRYEAIAATNALGMGIDKSDLRYVAHVDVPGSITAYYQEVGRAGRDGLPARGVLLYDPEDRRIQDYFIHSSKPSPADFDTVLAAVEREPLRLTDIRRVSGLHPTRVTVVVAELVEQGHLEKQAQGRTQYYARTGVRSPPDLARYARQQQVRKAGLSRMIEYAGGASGCLMQTLRVALGDADAEACGRCGACGGWSPGAASADGAGAAAGWMESRPVHLAGFRRFKLEDGRAIYDSGRRSEGFVRFMRERTREPLDAETLTRLIDVAQTYAPVDAIVPVPSRTWAGRDAVAAALAEALGAEVADLLDCAAEPQARQGELLNNDQRKANVEGTMIAHGQPPGMRTLLLDDYAGSGWTLRESARALRRGAGYEGELIPLTVASVRWRLGRAGIV